MPWHRLSPPGECVNEACGEEVPDEHHARRAITHAGIQRLMMSGRSMLSGREGRTSVRSALTAPAARPFFNRGSARHWNKGRPSELGRGVGATNGGDMGCPDSAIYYRCPWFRTEIAQYFPDSRRQVDRFGRYTPRLSHKHEG
jgi:hypothetical protein